MLATIIPVVIARCPVAVPMAVVVPTVNLLALSSQPIKALLPDEPLSIIIPASFVAASVRPLLNSINESVIVVFVVLTVVVVPVTVKPPDIVTPPANAVVPDVIVNISSSVFTIVAPLSKVVVPCSLPVIVTVSVDALPNVTLPSRVVAPLAVKLVNAPVEADEAPIAVPSIEPPSISTELRVPTDVIFG